VTKTKTSSESKPLAPLKEFEAATHHLASTDADWRELIRQVGPCRHQPKPAREPYEALIRAIAYQRLHAKART
jgi:DNA-3-methyladenine glycosylase II